MHSPQQGVPSGRVVREIRPSPHTEHTFPWTRTTSSTQASHTGNRLIFNRGALQKRQAEGKTVAKTLDAAMPKADLTEAIGEPRLAGSTLSARVRSPLLLKTTLLSPAFSHAGLPHQYSRPVKGVQSLGRESSMNSVRGAQAPATGLFFRFWKSNSRNSGRLCSSACFLCNWRANLRSST